ncbi:MAG: TetR family transcriptional regulator C-terminal domain-containing protein [Bacteroidota bacterium]
MDKQKEKLQQAYLSYVEANNKRPESIHIFAKSLQLTEAEFYNLYGSWASLEADMFLGFMKKAIEILEASKEFAEFSIRERSLSFFYTWIGKMQEHRSFILFIHEQDATPLFGQGYLKEGKETFISFARKLIKAGIENNEIADRWLVTRTYRQALWVKATSIYNYWISDGSANFEKTDAFIEKLVNFFFDLIEPNALDSGFDFAKFVLQGR